MSSSHLSCSYYRPQTKLREGNVFTGVRDSVHRGAAWSQGVAWSRGVPGPGGCLVPGGAWSQGGLVWGVGAWWRPPRTATAAGSKHHTGMHSCSRSDDFQSVDILEPS